MNATITKNGTSTHQEVLSDDEYEARLAQQAKEWRTHRGKSLQMHHDAGILFNQYLGLPTARNKKGAGVVKNAAERLGTTRSEISRARWCAHLFSSVQDLTTKHPDVKSWTGFKELLPKLKPRPTVQRKEGAPEADKAKAKKLKKVESLQNRLANMVSEVQKHLTPGEKHALQSQIDAFAEQTRKCLSEETQSPISASASDVSAEKS